MFINFMFAMIAAALFGGALSYGFYVEKQRLKKKQDRFSNRENLAVESIYNQFYKDYGTDIEDFHYLWKEISSLLCLDAGRLRPSDRFDQELRPVEGKEISDEQEDLYEFLKSLSESRNIKFEPKNYNTLDDIIKALGKQLK